MDAQPACVGALLTPGPGTASGTVVSRWTATGATVAAEPPAGDTAAADGGDGCPPRAAGPEVPPVVRRGTVGRTTAPEAPGTPAEDGSAPAAARRGGTGPPGAATPVTEERCTVGAGPVTAPPGGGAAPVMPSRGPGDALPDPSARGAVRPCPEPPPPGSPLAGAGRRSGTAAGAVLRWTTVLGGVAGRADVSARAGVSARTAGRGGADGRAAVAARCTTGRSTASATGVVTDGPSTAAERVSEAPLPAPGAVPAAGTGEATARWTGRPPSEEPDGDPVRGDAAPVDGPPAAVLARPGKEVFVRRCTSGDCPELDFPAGESSPTGGVAVEGGEDRGAPRAERRRGLPTVGTSTGGVEARAGPSAVGAPGIVRPGPSDALRWTVGPGPPGTPSWDGDTAAEEEAGGAAGVTAGPADAATGPEPGDVEVVLPAEVVGMEGAGGETAADRAPPAVRGEAGGVADRGVDEAPAAGRTGADGVTTGSARRCTAGRAGALVSPTGLGRVAAGGAGCTRGPAARVAATGRFAYGTDGAAAASPVSLGGATGSAREGSSRPEAGSAAVASTPRTSPPGAPSSTACESVPVNDGFCQVVSRPPNPASATEPRPAVARWMGGSVGQAAARTPGATTPPPAPLAPVAPSVPGVVPVPVPEGTADGGTAAPAGPGADVPPVVPVVRSRPPPRSRSKTPTPRHPSPAPRWTSAAICSV